MTWIQEQVHFDQSALETTLLDYVHEVEHMAERIERLEKAITQAIQNVADPWLRPASQLRLASQGSSRFRSPASGDYA